MKLLVSISLLLTCLFAKAQFGNEWIDFNQSYFKIKIVNDGIYRIDHSTMLAAGVPVASILPQDFQVFGKEAEVYIEVEDGNDGSFDNGDYIQFYAQKNDGCLDSLLYTNPNNILNPSYSLANDTLIYYLSWRSGSNRRIVDYSNTNFGSFTAIPFAYKKDIVTYTGTYQFGSKIEGNSSSKYTDGEGWSSANKNAYASGTGSYINIALSNTSLYTAAGAPDVQIHAISTSTNNPNPNSSGWNHHLQYQHNPGSGYIPVIDTVFYGYQLNKFDFTISNADYSSSSTIRFRLINDLAVGIDLQSASYTHAIYPHTFDLNNQSYYELTVPHNTSESHSLIQISNFNGANPLIFILTDTVKKIIPSNNGTWDALIPNHPNGLEQRIIVLDSTEIQTISSTNLKPINPTTQFTDFISSPLDSAYIIITHSSLLSEATNYANYRASASGGNHEVLVTDVDELYHQYGGGIEKHNLAIKRFLKDIYQNFPTRPKYVFLLGKSIRDATDGDPGSRKNITNFHNNLVPTYGYPASDNFFVTDLDTVSDFVQQIAIGRLAAKDSAEVQAYLDKMIEFEDAQSNPIYTSQDKEWMKNVLHFSGGATSSEQILFQQYLNNYATIIEDTCFGGHTNLHAKTSSQPIDIVEFQEIKDELEEGASLITFFGHASPTGFDQNIDDPQNWNNQGKYPFLIGNSCYTGDIHHPQSISTSEDFVLIPQRGTIGFLASTKLGFAFHLDAFTSEMYRQIGQKNYGASIGICQMQASEHIFNQGGAGNIYYEMTVGQLNLHGDPALKLNPHSDAEIVISEPQIYFEPELIDLTVDSITMNVIITNLGKAFNDSFTLEAQRFFVDGSDTTYSIQVDGLYYKDTVSIKMPLLPNKSTGVNQFDVRVDLPSLIDEVYDEFNNNQVTKNLIIELEDILPIYPYNYAIIPDDSVTIKASTINPLASINTYIFEIDTIDFEGAPSPFKRQQVISSIGGVVEAYPADWTLSSNNSSAPLQLTDSTVYFWRVSIDSSVKNWHEHSFQYINGLSGWGQAHYYQFKNDDFSAIKYDRPNREFNFENRFRTIECVVYGNANNAFEYANTLWSLDHDNDAGETNLCTVTPSIHVAVVDPFELKAWENDGPLTPIYDFGDYKQLVGTNYGGCRNYRTEGYFIFRQNSTGYLANLDTMLMNGIPTGHYVLVYTTRQSQYANWNSLYPNLFTTLQNFGSTQVSPSAPDAPFIMFWQQGVAGTFQEIHGATINDTLIFEDTIVAPDYVGNMYSTIAGPAYQWNALHWEQHPQEIAMNDSVRLKLHGVDFTGNKTQLIDTLFSNQDSILNLNSMVDAMQYPYVQLQAFHKDSITFTPAHIDRWQLIYQPVPELALNPKKGFYFSALNDTVPEGTEVSIAMAVENVSPFDMDSLLVHYYLEDNYFNTNYASYPRQAPLLAGDVILDTISFSTEGFPEKNSIWIEANPYVLPNQQDQLEQYYFNNLARLTFHTTPDITNPILDVTFDGLHILDRDIVSAKPMIVMSLDDENELLLLDEDADTNNFKVYLTDPLGNLKSVYFMENGQENMRWIPASGDDNVFRIEYDAEFEMDGTYELNVQGTDISGNKSGSIDYEIKFEVINRSTITEVMNYPNPFSTRTQFVFTLTGSEVPDNMLIQIMTITGKVVREIDLSELGPLNIGRNRTSYWWDGRDEFGDQLANGVYLYHVTTRLNNEAIDLRESGADNYFHKGFGKMYLMR